MEGPLRRGFDTPDRKKAISLGADGSLAQPFKLQLRFLLADGSAATRTKDQEESQEESMKLKHARRNASPMPSALPLGTTARMARECDLLPENPTIG